MPRKRSRSVPNSVEQEGRILLAIQALNKGESNNVTDAARQFDVPRSTLSDRINGLKFRAEIRANSHKLTEIEDNSLLEWIYSMDSRGGAPRQYMVGAMGDLLLKERGSTKIQTVGKHWVANFVKRHPELKSSFSRRYDYQRAKQEDPRVIQRWFDLVQTTIKEKGILDEDIYNFDEIGFAIGLTSTVKVVTRSEYYGRRAVLQLGNRG